MSLTPEQAAKNVASLALREARIWRLRAQEAEARVVQLEAEAQGWAEELVQARKARDEAEEWGRELERRERTARKS